MKSDSRKADEINDGRNAKSMPRFDTYPEERFDSRWKFSCQRHQNQPNRLGVSRVAPESRIDI
jgi:hypothetical protein